MTPPKTCHPGLDPGPSSFSAPKATLSAWHRRTDTILRIVAAIPLGYGAASLWAMALARILPGDPAQVTIAATLIAFAICAIAAMWAFAARSGWHAVWTLALLAAAAATIAWTSISATGRA